MAEHTSGRPHAKEHVEEGILAMISTNRSMVRTARSSVNCFLSDSHSRPSPSANPKRKSRTSENVS